MLNDGSTDSSIIEQELIYILFLNEGVPTLKYFSIDSVSNVDVVGIRLPLLILGLVTLQWVC